MDQFPSKITFSFLASPVMIIGFGVLLRTVRYAANPSLWLDESALALNIIQRTYVDLFQPLDHGQAAPVGFLLLVKFATLQLGIGEHALRLIPFLSGIASLLLFHALAKRCLTLEAIPWALFLFAIASPLVHYSSELKQYSSDVFITLIILLAGLRARKEDQSFLSVAILGVTGAAGIWFSHPAAFVAGGVTLALTVSCAIRKNWNGAGLAVIAGMLTVLSFAAQYHFLLRNVKIDQFLEYWSQSFIPPPSSFRHLLWLYQTFIGLFSFPMGLNLVGMGAFSFLCGAISMLKRNRDTLFLLFFPALVTIVASALQRYPLRGRLVLFLAPFLAIIIADGIIQILEIGRMKRFSFGVLYLLLLFLNPLADAVVYLRYPEPGSKIRPSEELRPVLTYIREHWREGDLVYVYYSAKHAFRYYSMLQGADFKEVIIGIKSRNDIEKYRNDLDRLRGRVRVWILFSHVTEGKKEGKGINEENYMVDYLETFGKRRDRIQQIGASAYLFDLTDTPVTPPALSTPLHSPATTTSRSYFFLAQSFSSSWYDLGNSA